MPVNMLRGNHIKPSGGRPHEMAFPGKTIIGFISIFVMRRKTGMKKILAVVSLLLLFVIAASCATPQSTNQPGSLGTFQAVTATSSGTFAMSLPTSTVTIIITTTPSPQIATAPSATPSPTNTITNTAMYTNTSISPITATHTLVAVLKVDKIMMSGPSDPGGVYCRIYIHHINEPLPVLGISEDNKWFAVVLPTAENRGRGWARIIFFDYHFSEQSLPVISNPTACTPVPVTPSPSGGRGTPTLPNPDPAPHSSH